MRKRARSFLNWIAAAFIGTGLLATFVGFAPDIIRWVKNEAPIVEWTVSPTDGDSPLIVVADASITDPDNDDLTLSWYLDDVLQTDGSSTSHEFTLAEPGQYRLRVLVSDGRAEPVERVQLVTVSRPVIRLQSMNLDRPYSLEEPEKVIELPARIVTNGHALTIVGHSLQGAGMTIRAFEAAGAQNGRDGDDGQDGSPGEDGSGGNGEDGTDGDNGGHGHAGLSAGPIFIKAESIETTLTITNNGQAGGDGGDGGTGGDGGRGGKGRAAKDGVGAFGVGNCERGPGRGGNGGDGGTGGRGGNAGAGGDGGNIRIQAGDVTRLSLEALAGEVGTPGDGGERGRRGAGGAEGNTTRYCTSANRYGARGSNGGRGRDGENARIGSTGEISAKIGDDKFTSEDGRLAYP